MAVRVHLRLRLRQGVFQGEASLMVGFPLTLPSGCGRNGSAMAVLWPWRARSVHAWWRRRSRATRARQGVFLGRACAVRVCVCRGALGVLNGPSSQSEVAEAGRDGDVGGAPKAATLARWLPPKASRASMAKGEVLGAF